MDKTPVTKTTLSGSCRRFGLSRSIKKSITTKNELVNIYWVEVYIWILNCLHIFLQISTPDASITTTIVATPKLTIDISSSPNEGINTNNIKATPETSIKVAESHLKPEIHSRNVKDLKSSEGRSITSRKKYLSLPKHRKDKILKKKIDFTRTMDSEQCITLEEKESQPSDSQPKLVIPQKTSLIELDVSTDDHLEHVNKLKELIGIWKEGLLKGLNILASKTEPATEVEEICKKLNIPIHFIFE